VGAILKDPIKFASQFKINIAPFEIPLKATPRGSLTDKMVKPPVGRVGHESVGHSGGKFLELFPRIPLGDDADGFPFHRDIEAAAHTPEVFPEILVDAGTDRMREPVRQVGI
jgi:hypothetical protein